MAVHSFDLGEIVTVFQMSPAKGLMIEGQACVIDLVDDVDEYYIVRFRNDEGEYLSINDCPTYERFLDREGSNHEDPQQYVRKFNKRIGKVA